MTMLAQFAATGGGVPAYIEEVFSTYLYTGNGSTQTITNNIDLSTKGGLVWLKSRSANSQSNLLDTARGVNKTLYTSSAAGQSTDTDTLNAFNTNGFTLGAGTSTGGSNTNTYTYASWTFREKSKFFDVVTYTGTGSAQNISHSLGSTPGCIMVKRTDTTGDWQVYHRSIANTEYLVLNSTAAKATGTNRWNSTDPTSTVFTVGTDATVNASGGTYVAYIYAHDAGGFGLAGTDNVISCGSVVNTGNPQVTLGYEPQWVLFKSSTSTSSWYIVDNMRGLPVGSDQAVLLPNTSGAEVTNSNYININATGFTTNSSLFVGETLIYIAIRRGPMKVPTDGTTVFKAALGNGSTPAFVSDFPVSAAIWGARAAFPPTMVDRLRGNVRSVTSLTDAESAQSNFFDSNTGFESSRASTSIAWMFQRAPSFFDEVCYTGLGYPNVITLNHNLGVAPELMIVKSRTQGATYGPWCVYSAALGATGSLFLNTDAANGSLGSNLWNSTAPTASVFTIGTGTYVNYSASDTYVAYLFATCAGVSKVGSYTGTGTTKQIDCGFTAGARWVMIKRTDGTGNWYVWDSTRGIVSGNDPYLLLNVNNNGEVTSTDYVDTYAAGFELSSTAPAALNASGGTYIFLAIA